MRKLGFIGTGKMAGAIIGGILSKALALPNDIGVYDISFEQTAPFADAGCHIYGSVQELIGDCQIVFFSVKPQVFPNITDALRASAQTDTLFVSIMAGVSAETIKQAVGFDCKVILVMPNTPLLLGQGATALAKVEPTTQAEFDVVRELFAAAGVAEEITPTKMCEVIPVNGSSPAFVYRFAQVLINSAVNSGISKDAAKNLVIQTLIGSAHMLRDSGSNAQSLIDMVCSPGGTTLAAMKALEENGFSHALEEAFSACVCRAEELARGE